MIKGWSNIVTFSCIVVAGIVEAAEQALKDAPKFAALFPHWLSGSFWNYVPLTLLVVGGTVWVLGKLTAKQIPRQSSPPEKTTGNWKPAWQRLQWATAERERLEGEVRKWKDMYTAENIEKTDFQKETARTKKHAEELEIKLSEATKPDTSLHTRTIATCDVLKEFVKEYGPKPDITQQLGESEDDHASRVIALYEWKGKMGADCRLRLSDSVRRMRDEIQVRYGMAEGPLDKAIELAESQLCEPQFVEEIRKHLWKCAFTMT